MGRPLKEMRICIILLFAASLVISSCSKKDEVEINEEAAAVVINDTLPRSAITFIMGRDENLHNPYYSLASDYYRLNEAEKTEVVIDSFTTISGVLYYLANHRPANGRPWGLINLVSHGNEFNDLSCTVTSDGQRVSATSLEQALERHFLTPLDSTIIDERTLVHLHGCAVGKNTTLLSFLGRAFGVKPPTVKASKLFEYYSNTSPSRNPMLTKHYYARVWYAFFRPDMPASISDLAEDLKERYPNEKVDWEAALIRTHPDDPSEEYHTQFFVPVSAEEFFKTQEEFPDVRARSRQEQWIEAKPEFQQLMARTTIPRQYFETKFFRNVYTPDSLHPYTATTYSLRVKSRAGVICIIKPLLDTTVADQRSFPPYIPSPNDTTLFGFGKR